MRAILIVAIAMLPLLWTSAAEAQTTAGGHDRERSPFTDVRFEGDRAQVLVKGEWYEWLEIDGVPYNAILQVAQQRYPNDWQRRIAEDLLFLLDAMGTQPGDTVRLKVRSLEHGTIQTLPAVAMTNANRNQIRDSRRTREIESPVDPAAAMDELVGTIREHHAYATLKSLDLDALAREATRKLGDSPSRQQTILAAQRLIARLGDGHAGVEQWEQHAPPGYLDFLLQHTRDGIVAFRRDPRASQGRFLDADHPFVVSVDGVPIESWIDAASKYVADGSHALVRRRSTELLRYANLVRDELKLPRKPEIAITLRNAERSSTRDIRLPLADRRPVYGSWPRTTSRVLESGFGYIRLDSMILTTDDLAAVERTLDSMADTPGLIIDVRDNGGGFRDAINSILPRLLDPTEPSARVVNVARLKLTEGEDPDRPEGYLADRFGYPANWPDWLPFEKAEIERLSREFRAEWQPLVGHFSQPHYMVVSRDAGHPTYDRPVVVLMDEGSFSATDIFLGAVKGLPNVTLMGMPSSGGSARSTGHSIDSLGIEVKLATMVSCTPDGRLYDGNGITPDIIVPPIATDLIGSTDAQLDAAITHLRSKQ